MVISLLTMILFNSTTKALDLAVSAPIYFSDEVASTARTFLRDPLVHSILIRNTTSDVDDLLETRKQPPSSDSSYTVKYNSRAGAFALKDPSC